MNKHAFSLTSTLAVFATLIGSTPAFAVDAVTVATEVGQATGVLPQPSPTAGALSQLAGVAAPGQRSGGGGILGCAAPGSKQAIGAVGGAAVGGLIGNRIAGSNKTLGTIAGAALGGLGGSWLGCKLQRNDQAKAQRALQAAAINGRNQHWASAETGASGDVNVTNAAGPDLGNLQFAPGVEPASAFNATSGAYVTSAAATLRGAPSTRGKVISRMARGTQISVPAGVKNTPWLLVADNGVARGYVSSSVVRRASRGASACRTIQHTIHMPDGGDSTETMKACPDAKGQWTMTPV